MINLRGKFWLIVLFIAVAVSFMLSLFLFKKDKKLYILNFREPSQYGKQIAKERVWVKVYTKNLLNLTSFLFQPMKIIVDKKGNIYVLDYGDMKIKKFSDDGRFIRSIGKGRGKGPGEFVNPTDFLVDDEYKVWVCDAVNDIITVFDSIGNVVKTFRPKGTPFRLAFGNREIVIQVSYGAEHLFEVYDEAGNFKFSFGEGIIPEQSKFPLLMEGEIDVSEGFLYCGFSYIGYIYCFDLRDRKLKFMIKNIDNLPIPPIEVLKIGEVQIRGIKPGSPIQVKSINVERGNIFIESGTLADETTIIDVYSSFDGRYLYSFKIPEKFNRGYFDGRYYYGVKDTVVAKWEVLFK